MPFFIGVLFSSCLGLKIDAKVSAAGKTEALVQYSISVAALELAASNSSLLYLPLSIDRKVFSDRVLANSGELVSWSMQSRTDSYFVDARVAFPTTESFCAFLDAEKKILRFDSIDTGSKLSVTIPESKTDPEFLNFLETAFSQDSIELSLELPRVPRIGKGFKLDRNKATFSGTAASLFASKSGTALELSW